MSPTDGSPEPTAYAATAASDLLELLRDAEAAGLSTDRARQLRDRLGEQPPLPLRRVVELERSIRSWLERRETRAAAHVTSKRLSQ